MYHVSKDIGRKTFMCQLNLGMWPLKSIISEKQALFWGFQHTFMGFLKEIDQKTFIFSVNLGMWPLKSIVLEKRALFWGFQHTFMGFTKEIDGKMFIFRLNLGMLLTQINCLGKTEHRSEGFNTHLWGLQGR